MSVLNLYVVRIPTYAFIPLVVQYKQNDNDKYCKKSIVQNFMCL